MATCMLIPHKTFFCNSNFDKITKTKWLVSEHKLGQNRYGAYIGLHMTTIYQHTPFKSQELGQKLKR